MASHRLWSACIHPADDACTHHLAIRWHWGRACEAAEDAREEGDGARPALYLLEARDHLVYDGARKVGQRKGSLVFNLPVSMTPACMTVSVYLLG